MATSSTQFEVVDLTTEGRGGDGVAEVLGTVDLGGLRSQLEQIRDELVSVTKDQPAGFSLQTLEIDLTISAEGKVWFIAKGSAEASIKLTFGHPSTP